MAAEVRETTGRRAFGHECHVGRWADIDELAETAYARFERVDILVNNAGKAPVYDTPADVTEELWRKVIDVNLTGPFRLTALIGARMSQDGEARSSTSAAWPPNNHTRACFPMRRRRPA